MYSPIPLAILPFRTDLVYWLYAGACWLDAGELLNIGTFWMDKQILFNSYILFKAPTRPLVFKVGYLRMATYIYPE